MGIIISTTVLNLLLVGATAQQYQLVASYTPANFFENFEFFTAPDPTDGFVQYVDNATAFSTRLAVATQDLIYLGVDHTHFYPTIGPGRPSMRVQSKMAFTEGLFVLDLAHIPVGCGTWPAYWTVGPEWPKYGEIDIVEGINDATQNGAALHVDGDCTVGEMTAQTATLTNTNCSAQHNGNVGCTAKFNEPDSYGQAFNLNGGGTYVMEWTNSSISIWFFPPALVPYSLSGAYSFDPKISFPDPSTFGVPSAVFSGPCSDSFPAKFFNHSIVFDTTFCGSWAGDAYSSSSCPKAPGLSGKDACEDFVARNPAAFTQAWWGIRSLRVWQNIVSYETPLSVVDDYSDLPVAVSPGHGAIQFPGAEGAITPDVAESDGLETLAPNETSAEVTSAPGIDSLLPSENPLLNLSSPTDVFPASATALLDEVSSLLSSAVAVVSDEPLLLPAISSPDLESSFASELAPVTTALDEASFTLTNSALAPPSATSEVGIADEVLASSPFPELPSTFLRAPGEEGQSTSIFDLAGPLLSVPAVPITASPLPPSAPVLGFAPTATSGLGVLDAIETGSLFDGPLAGSSLLNSIETEIPIAAFQDLGVSAPGTSVASALFSPDAFVGSVPTSFTTQQVENQLLGIPATITTLSSEIAPVETAIAPTDIPSTQSTDSIASSPIYDVPDATTELPPQAEGPSSKLESAIELLKLLVKLAELLAPATTDQSAGVNSEALPIDLSPSNSTKLIALPTSNASSNYTRPAVLPSTIDSFDDTIVSDLPAYPDVGIAETGVPYQREAPAALPYTYSYPSGETGDWVTVDVPPAFDDDLSGKSASEVSDEFTAFWNNGLNPMFDKEDLPDDDPELSAASTESKVSSEAQAESSGSSPAPVETPASSTEFLGLPAESSSVDADTLVLPAKSVIRPEEEVAGTSELDPTEAVPQREVDPFVDLPYGSAYPAYEAGDATAVAPLYEGSAGGLGGLEPVSAGGSPSTEYADELNDDVDADDVDDAGEDDLVPEDGIVQRKHKGRHGCGRRREGGRRKGRGSRGGARTRHYGGERGAYMKGFRAGRDSVIEDYGEEKGHDGSWTGSGRGGSRGWRGLTRGGRPSIRGGRDIATGRE